MQLDFAKLGGLVPSIVQDAASGEVLMLGFMNEQVLRGYAEPRVRSRFTAARAGSCGARAGRRAGTCCASVKCAWIATMTLCWCAWIPLGRACAMRATGVAFSGVSMRMGRLLWWLSEPLTPALCTRRAAPSTLRRRTPSDETTSASGCLRAACRMLRCNYLRAPAGASTTNSRSYYPAIDDPEITCMLVRAQEMARYVETGALDAALSITGRDWVLETGADVVEDRQELAVCQARVWRLCRWVLAVPEEAPVHSPKDLEGTK